MAATESSILGDLGVMRLPEDFAVKSCSELVGQGYVRAVYSCYAVRADPVTGVVDWAATPRRSAMWHWLCAAEEALTTVVLTWKQPSLAEGLRRDWGARLWAFEYLCQEDPSPRCGGSSVAPEKAACGVAPLEELCYWPPAFGDPWKWRWPAPQAAQEGPWIHGAGVSPQCLAAQRRMWEALAEHWESQIDGALPGDTWYLRAGALARSWPWLSAAAGSALTMCTDEHSTGAVAASLERLAL